MNGGYGIAGHKNNYKTGVLNGNWVQDTIGLDLVRNPRNNHVNLTTEQKSNYIDPKAMPNKCAHAPQGPIIMRAEEVVAHHMLFGHGTTESVDPTAGKHFVTMNQAILGSHERTDEVLKQNSWSMESGIASNEKTKNKFIQIEKEKEDNVYQTTSNLSFSRNNNSSFTKKRTTGQNFTKGFTAGIPNLRK